VSVTHLEDYRPTAEIPAPWLQPTPALYVRRTLGRRIATSRFAADARRNAGVIGFALAAVTMLAGQLGGAW
jgi:hypothetical protein